MNAFRIIPLALLGIAITSIWIFFALCQGHQPTPADLGSLFSGWAFVGLIATLVHNHQSTNAARRLASEVYYLQAVAGQMNAYSQLVQHAREDVWCEDFKRKLIVLANEFELARHRAALPLGIDMK